MHMWCLCNIYLLKVNVKLSNFYCCIFGWNVIHRLHISRQFFQTCSSMIYTTCVVVTAVVKLGAERRTFLMLQIILLLTLLEKKFELSLIDNLTTKSILKLQKC